ncbi:MAG: hypothetical protein RL149_625 [Actinomycetota bacterium]
MKANRFARAVGFVAATALTITGLTAVAMAPASAAARSTVIIHTSGQITSLNPSVVNSVYNANVNYLTSAGFTYYDKDTKLVRNTNFGSFAVSKNSSTDFRITYNVKAGQVWSDGTPIDAVDLLLSHVVSSSAYSKAAGLGDPSDKTQTPAFDSSGYSGSYSDHIVGLPTLSNNNMTLTLRFNKTLPDWELLAPGPTPVHALELMAAGKKALGTLAANKAAKAQFLKDFTSKNTATLKKIGKIWSESYNIDTVSSSTNPLLLISNGGFIVKSATPTTMTLVRNAKYSSGPKMAATNPIKTIVFSYIPSSTAAAAALRNGDVDIFYEANGTAASKATLDAIRSATVVNTQAAVYSHIDLRTAPKFGKTNDPYTGPFAGNGDKAKDLRHAFLLALDRQQLVDVVVKPIKSTATPMDTQFAFPGTPAYNSITSQSGVAEYSAGTQADRTAKALALVKKWYPTASDSNAVVKLKFGFASTSGVRVTISKLVKAQMAKIGFDVDIAGSADWLGDTSPEENSEWDISMYAFQLSSLTQANATEVYKSDGGNNNWGWSNSTLDTIATSLQSDYLTSAQVLAKRIAADKIVHDNYWGLPLYQNVSLIAYTKSLVGVKPSPLSPSVVWNYWEWHY